MFPPINESENRVVASLLHPKISWNISLSLGSVFLHWGAGGDAFQHAAYFSPEINKRVKHPPSAYCN